MIHRIDRYNSVSNIQNKIISKVQPECFSRLSFDPCTKVYNTIFRNCVSCFCNMSSCNYSIKNKQIDLK